VATVDCFIAASPRDVFAVLADGWTYSNWVVGTSHMRAVEATWPQAGSKLHHASGVWPLALRDESEVTASEPPHRLALTVRGRPFGEAAVEITVTPEAGGSRVVMLETPVSGPGKWLHNPVSELLLVRRNVETLARLTTLAERRTSPPS
jgi:uncharacterized protein YndB with AHSA1/START domain